MTLEPTEDIPPLTASGAILREVAVIGERVGNLKETFDDFRRETRDNFEAQKQAAGEMKAELKADALAIREEMRKGLDHHEQRLGSLEEWRAAERGGLSVGKWLWGASLGLIGAAGTVLGWIGAHA